MDGQPVFTCLFNIWVDKVKNIEGDLVSKAIQKVVVVFECLLDERCYLSKRINRLKNRVGFYHGLRLVWKCALSREAKRQLCQGPWFSRTSRNHSRVLTLPEVTESSFWDFSCCIKGRVFMLPQEIWGNEIHRGEPVERDQDQVLG